MSWHIGDTHFFHQKIIQYCGRPWYTAHAMNEEIIKRWNEVIGPDTVVYHHGDVSLSDKADTKSVIKRLNGYKILILGNHDRRSKGWFKEVGFDEVHKNSILLNDHYLTHCPMDPELPYKYNIHGHIHNKETTFLPPRYINTSVEVIDYRPIWIDTKKKEE